MNWTEVKELVEGSYRLLAPKRLVRQWLAARDEEVLFRGPGKVSQAVLGGADLQFEKPNDFLAGDAELGAVLDPHEIVKRTHLRVEALRAKPKDLGLKLRARHPIYALLAHGRAPFTRSRLRKRFGSLQ